MASAEDRRAAVLLLILAAVGLVVRLLTGGGGASGGLLYRPGEAAGPPLDSLAARASRLARPLVVGEKIDLDRAGADELVRLPRIGPGLAARIVADRDANGPFGSLEAVDRVPGVGPTVLQAIAPHALFSGRTQRRPSPGRAVVRLNTATEDELAQLPGVGSVRARAIVEDRRRHGPFRTLESLTRVRGIGPATVERLRELAVPP